MSRHGSFRGVRLLSSESLSMTAPFAQAWDGESAISMQLALQLPPKFKCGQVLMHLQSAQGIPIMTLGVHVCEQWAKHVVFKIYEQIPSTTRGSSSSSSSSSNGANVHSTTSQTDSQSARLEDQFQWYSLPDNANGTPKHRAFTDSRVHHYRLDLLPNPEAGDFRYALYMDGFKYGGGASLVEHLEHPTLRRHREMGWAGRPVPTVADGLLVTEAELNEAMITESTGQWKHALRKRFKEALASMSAAKVTIETRGDCTGVMLYGAWVAEADLINDPGFMTYLLERLPLEMRQEESSTFYGAIKEEERQWRAEQRRISALRESQDHAAREYHHAKQKLHSDEL